MRKIAVGLLCLVILLGCVAGYAASDDGLVSLNYLNETFLPQLLEQTQSRIAEKTQAAYQTALEELESTHRSYLDLAEGGTQRAASLTDGRYKKGDVLTLSAGSGAMLLAGSASVSFTGGAVIDVTAGQTLPSGSALTQRHRCLAGENTTAVFTVTSDTAVISLEGNYTYRSGSGVDYNAMADALKDLGLFQGTGTAYGSGYDLEVAPTRIVGLVMFLRLMGEEGAALRSTAVNPFGDTPAWCDRYVAYAYERGYTNGVGTDQTGRLVFGTDNPLTAEEYLTFLLRALGYTDSGAAPDFTWSTAASQSVALGVINSAERAMLESGPFLRAQVVYLSYVALSAPLKDGSGVLLDRTASNSGTPKAAMEAILNSASVSRLS